MSTVEFLMGADFGDERIVHGFTTRNGGVSPAPYDSLNLSWSRGDEPEKIEENRHRVARALGDVELVFLNQIHSDTVIEVTAKPDGVWSAGQGDALITNVPGLALCAQTADCVPVLLYDPENAAIAAIHSGWRGTVKNLVAKTVAAMTERYGSQPGALHGVIGPAISKAHYRVGREVLEQFEALFGSLDEGLIGPVDGEGGAGLDVSEACRRQLMEAGVSVKTLTRLDYCTYKDEARFFSSRRAATEGTPGRFGGQCGIIALKR